MSRRRPEIAPSCEPWPAEVDRAEPFAEPDHFDAARVIADYRVCGGEAAADAVLAATQALRLALASAWRGDGDGAVRDLAAFLLVDAPRRARERHYPPQGGAADDARLARIAADILPGIGNDAPDRLLGPWAAVADRKRDRRLLMVATAAGMFMAPDETPFDARHQWARRKPQPDERLRGAVRAVAHGWCSAWPIEAVDGERIRLGSGVGGAPGGWVAGGPIATLPGAGPVRAGDTLLARRVDLPGGAVVRLAIGVPGPPPAAAEAWVDLLLLEHRLTDRRAAPRDVLRGRGHVLHRRVLEDAWIR